MSTPTRTRTMRQRLRDRVTGAVTVLTTAWRALARAQAVLLRALARIRPGRTAAARIRRALADFHRAVAAFDRDAAALATRWAAVDLPAIYRGGALQAMARTLHSAISWTWTGDHQATVTGLTATYYTHLMGRITETVRRAQAFARDAVDQARRRTGVDPDTLLREHPLDTVVYGNEARHPVHSWATSALTWQAVTTANTAAAETALRELGCDWVEVRDGSGCGWRTHDDPDIADGSLRTIQDALANPAAHPNCRRELLPRPDLTEFLAPAP